MSNTQFVKADFKLGGQSVGISASNIGILPNPHYIAILYLYVRPDLMISRDFSIAFQITNIPDVALKGCLSQSNTFRGAMYLDVATFVHRLFEVMRCQSSFATKAEEKSSSFLIPQPPHFFGICRASHLTQAKILLG